MSSIFLYDYEPVAGRMALSLTLLRASQSDSLVDAFDDGRRETIEAGREANSLSPTSSCDNKSGASPHNHRRASRGLHPVPEDNLNVRGERERHQNISVIT